MNLSRILGLAVVLAALSQPTFGQNNDDAGALPSMRAAPAAPGEPVTVVTVGEWEPAPGVVLESYRWGDYECAFVGGVNGVGGLEWIAVRGRFLGIFPPGTVGSLPGGMNAAHVAVTACWTSPPDDGGTPDDESDDTPGVADWVTHQGDGDTITEAVGAFVAVRQIDIDAGWESTPGACPPLALVPEN